MHLIDKLNIAQRVVIVVAIGVALAVTGSYLVSLGSGFHVGFGWTGIASQAMWPPGAGLPGWVILIIWLGLTGVWALASVIVLRPPRGPAEPDWRPLNRES